MDSLCERCGKRVSNPVLHEFCYISYKGEGNTAPKTREKSADPIFREEWEVASHNQPPHYPEKEPIPIQKPIKHDIAPVGAKPPLGGLGDRTRYYESKDDLTDDSYSANARKAME